MIIKNWTWQHFLKSKGKWACNFKENDKQYLMTMTKFELSNQNLNFGKHVYHHLLDIFQYLMTLHDLKKKKLYEEIYKHLKDLCN